MRLVILLIAVLLVGLLVYKQISPRAVQQSEEIKELSSSGAPQVPTNPEDVKEFRTQINEYINEEAEKRAAALEKATAQ
ncbi:hypothetical protein ACQUQP_15820 [Marinobacterium sp. YM272]|uniref:hypothetical protein n=1 Tax=Marinobacterium sp. YM272 TaxID=3421654 RepID=UPI003D7FE54A